MFGVEERVQCHVVVNEDQKPETAGAAGTMTVRRYIYALMLGS
jgi:hypothetical protein